MLSLEFKEVPKCNMCYSAVDNFQVMGLRLNQSQGLRPMKKKGVAVSICKCKHCGLIFSNPQPIPKHFDDQYDISPSDYWGNIDFKWDNMYFQKELSILKTFDFQFEGKKALDIGAGIGKCLLSMSAVGMDAYGFEPAKSFYEIGIKKYNLSTEKFQLSTIENISYPDNYFDFITFGAVLEHLHDPDECLRKALRWLKPGGYIHIEVPSANWFISKLYNFYYKWICFTNFVTNISPMHSPFHHYEFTERCFQENARHNGYKVQWVKTEVCDTTLPIRFFDRILKKYMRLSNTGLQLIIFLKKDA